MINRVTIVGTLARDPRVRTTGTGKKVADFAVAIPRRFAPSDPAQSNEDILKVRCWTENAEYISRDGAKGMPVEIDGRIEVDRYRETGGQPDSFIVVAERIELTQRRDVVIDDYQEFDPREVLNPCRPVSTVAQHMGGEGTIR